MASHGGKRAGAGRKKGSANKFDEQARKMAAESGILPLEFMLNVMRDEEQDFATRFDAAKAAAPYVHARLASVDQTVTHKHDTTEFSTAELAAIASAGSAGATESPVRPQKLN